MERNKEVRGQGGERGKRGSAMIGCEFHSGQSEGGLVTISSLSTEGEERKKELKRPLQSLSWTDGILLLSLFHGSLIL